MTQLQTLTLEAGETVWRNGIPMRLTQLAEVELHAGNVVFLHETRGCAVILEAVRGARRQGVCEPRHGGDAAPGCRWRARGRAKRLAGTGG